MSDHLVTLGSVLGTDGRHRSLFVTYDKSWIVTTMIGGVTRWSQSRAQHLYLYFAHMNI